MLQLAEILSLFQTHRFPLIIYEAIELLMNDLHIVHPMVGH